MEHGAGRGSYGTVYKAKIRETGELVAIKIIPLGDASEMEEVQREITMLQECNHPNVVRYMVRNASLTLLTRAAHFPRWNARFSVLILRFPRKEILANLG